MKKECVRCEAIFETSGETVTLCGVCLRKYRIEKGLQKPEGWERKTANLKEYHKEYRKANPERMRAYERKRKKRTPEQERQRYVAKMKKLHGEDWVPSSERPKDPIDLEKQRNREKYKTALKRGKLVKTPCMVCGESEVEGHHPDYSRPLDVVWLCRKHHMEIHGKS